MSSKLLNILNYEIGDEVWWFKVRGAESGLYYHFGVSPGDIELVHDTVKEIKEGRLICWHGTHNPNDIWGKTRQQAWETLKANLEKWGKLD